MGAESVPRLRGLLPGVGPVANRHPRATPGLGAQEHDTARVGQGSPHGRGGETPWPVGGRISHLVWAARGQHDPVLPVGLRAPFPHPLQGWGSSFSFRPAPQEAPFSTAMSLCDSWGLGQTGRGAPGFGHNSRGPRPPRVSLRALSGRRTCTGALRSPTRHSGVISGPWGQPGVRKVDRRQPLPPDGKVPDSQTPPRLGRQLGADMLGFG